MPELISAVVELLLLSLPTIAYLVVRRKRTDGGRAAMGLTWGSRSDYLVAAGIAVVLIGLGLGVTRLLPADVLAVAG